MIKKWFEFFANILFWLLTIWLLKNSFITEVKEIEEINGVETIIESSANIDLPRLLTTSALSLILFYANLWNILRLAKGIKIRKVINASILIISTIIVIHYFIHSYFIPPDYLSGLPIFIWSIFTFYFTISIAYGIAKVWEKTEQQRQQLAFEKKQAELSTLRAQLHPHFLFNVLNNLLAMVDQQSNPALATSLDRLSNLLRYVVYDTANPKVAVRKEINFIKNFADLQSLRFEKNEIDFDLEVIGVHDQQKIEPGIFIPFVENTFKYGVEPEHQSQIKISFDLTAQNKIIFSISNPIRPLMQTNLRKGTGILSSKTRLNLVYPNKHKIAISENEIFHVHIEIETDASNNS